MLWGLAWRELEWNISIVLDIEELGRSRTLIRSGDDTHLAWTEPLARAAGAPEQRVKRSMRQRPSIFLKFFMVLCNRKSRSLYKISDVHPTKQ